MGRYAIPPKTPPLGAPGMCSRSPRLEPSALSAERRADETVEQAEQLEEKSREQGEKSVGAL